jgi:hypothetical protein
MHLNLVADVLDEQIVDSKRRQAGRVDGIVLELRADRPPRLAYIEISPITLLSRFNDGWHTGTPDMIGSSEKAGRTCSYSVESPHARWTGLRHGPRRRVDADLRARGLVAPSHRRTNSRRLT